MDIEMNKRCDIGVAGKTSADISENLNDIRIV